MTRIIDDWRLRYPGIKHVEHVYLYRAAVADAETIRGYLERSYLLGKEFAPDSSGEQSATSGRGSRSCRVKPGHSGRRRPARASTAGRILPPRSSPGSAAQSAAAAAPWSTSSSASLAR